MFFSALPLPLLALILLQQPQAEQSAPQTTPVPPKGTVLFERHEAAPDDLPAENKEQQPEKQPALLQRTPAVSSSNPVQDPTAGVPDTERLAVLIDGYDLDMHLDLATGQVTTRALLHLTNRSNQPLQAIPLQISSSLSWQSARLRNGHGSVPLQFEQHPLQTDADHTGLATEIVMTLPQPLAPGESASLDLFYGGAVVENGDRLVALGAAESQAVTSDWDGFNVAAPVSGVRGFGNVLWYPVAQGRPLLGKGNSLFDAVANTRMAQQNTPFHLRLMVESTRPLSDAFFCSQPQPLQPAKRDDAGSPYLYTAEWALPAIGQRLPSLFVAAPAAITPDSGQLHVYTNQKELVDGYNQTARAVRPLMQTWFGNEPLRPLLLLDLGKVAQPMEDGALVALQLRQEKQDTLAPAMTEWLTHTYFQSPDAWMTEGLASFMEGLWFEREARGRRDAETPVTMDPTEMSALSVYETTANQKEKSATYSSSADSETMTPHLPLTRCAEPVCYRTKGAAVWRMLREMVGDDALQQALQSFRSSQETGSPESRAAALEAVLERTSGKDLGEFFDDWVLHDNGLPELNILAIAPRQVPAINSSIIGSNAAAIAAPMQDKAHTTGGWLVAVEVGNEGNIAADVPVTLRSPAYTTTERMHIAAHSRTTLRMLVPSAPSEVFVNDGSVPEVAASTHHRIIATHKE